MVRPARIYKKDPTHKIKIDWEDVYKMLECGCTAHEVAATIGMHQDTLYIRCYDELGIGWTQLSADKRAKGCKILRAKQQELAAAGDKVMLVWLGKQVLDQRDDPKKSTEFNGKLADLLDYLKIAKPEDFKRNDGSPVIQPKAT